LSSITLTGEKVMRVPIILDPQCPEVKQRTTLEVANRQWRREHQAQCELCQRAQDEYDSQQMDRKALKNARKGL
jgi:hypothetical protein